MKHAMKWRSLGKHVAKLQDGENIVLECDGNAAEEADEVRNGLNGTAACILIRRTVKVGGGKIVNTLVELFDSKSAYVRKLIATLRSLNLDLADLFPPLLDVSETPATGQELVTQLRLLHSTVGVKLDQFDRSTSGGDGRAEFSVSGQEAQSHARQPAASVFGSDPEKH